MGEWLSEWNRQWGSKEKEIKSSKRDKIRRVMLDLGLTERELSDVFTRSDTDVTCPFHFSFVVHHHHLSHV